MNTEKQEVATEIKQLVAELAAKMEKAEAAGLVVELATPNSLSLAHRGPLAVAIWEKLSY